MRLGRVPCRRPALELPLSLWRLCCRVRPWPGCAWASVPLGSRGSRSPAYCHWGDYATRVPGCVTARSERLPSGRKTSAASWMPGSATRRCAGKSSLLRRWRAGTAAAPRTPGGGMATADMDGSGRCIGRSPFTISTTTPSGVMASASGTTAILTFMPRSLRLTAMRILPPMPDRARTAGDLAGCLGCRSSAAMTEAKLPSSPSIRFEWRCSRMRRSAPLWTILPTH